jgi:hypothetical protein
MQIARKGRRITTLEEWREHAPPKGKDAQWEEGRSAKEVAKAWTTTPGQPAPPHDLIALLNAHPAFANLSIDTATPEERLAFDDLPGEVSSSASKPRRMNRLEVRSSRPEPPPRLEERLGIGATLICARISCAQLF